ncbi:MAG: alpha-mannosidase [Bacteroidales bacterium]|nr:alpha-mannosidase [Bacteroidales bacterium]
MKNVLGYIVLLFLLVSCGRDAIYADFADTSIGAIDKRWSSCVIGPQMPYGSIAPSPQTEKGSMDGYHPDYPIRGFGQLHVSGTGWSSYGHFLISPMTGLSVGLTEHDSDHSGDITRPYLYKTHLDRYGIDVEVAPSHYSAIYRFTFPQSEESVLLFDAAHSVVGDIATEMNGNVLENVVDVDPETNTIRMKLRFKGGWPGEPYDLYCLCRYDADAEEFGVWEGESVYAGQTHVEKSAEGVHRGAYCRFDTRRKQTVHLKVSLSFTGFDKAEELMAKEIPGFNFDKVMRKGIKAWDDKFSRAHIESLSDEDRTIFYSALYRVFTLARDRSEDNSKWETDMPFWDDNYAFWDTFRTAYPLITLLDEEAMRDNINAMIDRFRHNGCVYDGFIAGVDRKPEQGGNDVDHVIVDAFLKGVKGVDWDEAYKIVKHNADNRRIGHLKWFEKQENAPEAFMYKEQGWIPYRVMSTSQSLEFSYNDYSAALMAKALGYEEDYLRYETRSHQWVNLWNPELENRGYKGFVDARNADGTFEFVRADKMGGSWTSPFYEGSAWTYSYYVPHDFDRLIELMGGNEAFVERLEHGFRNRLVKYDNEPGFLAPRAFAHAGRPDLASYWVHDTMDKGFDLTGYPGNEDTGSMGSWYVFCYLGLFPNAGQDFYYLNAPRCTEARLSLADGKTLQIKADAGKGRVYIKSVKVNGTVWNSPFIRHSDIAGGGLIEFELSDVPTGWGMIDLS